MVVLPADQAVAFTREDESQTIRFQVRAPLDVKPQALASPRPAAGGQQFKRGYGD
jgi:hypothetical protein